MDRCTLRQCRTPQIQAESTAVCITLHKELIDGIIVRKVSSWSKAIAQTNSNETHDGERAG